jgi:uncharacterized phage infection (PIP) family protein YhgE
MKRKLLLALAVMSALGVASSGANAQSDEGKEEKKPEQSQLVVQQGPTSKPVLVADDEKKETEKPQLIADDEKKDAPKPELIAEGDDTFPKGSAPELVADEDKKDAPKPELIA